MTERNWSSYQLAIYEWMTNGEGNAIIRAVAGSGKSTTLVECVSRVPKNSTHIFLAFNKAIATELEKRGVNARTFHSLCYTPVIRHKGARTVMGDKLHKIVNEQLGDRDVKMYGSFVCKLVSMGKNAGIGCLLRDTPDAWLALIDHHDLELDHDDANIDRAIDLASQMLTMSNQSKMVDFDDLLYLAVRDGLSLPKFDYVFGDEMQDTNAIQRAVLRKIMKPNSRFVGVGDEAQAIYGFRGADSDSMALLSDEFHCVSLPLTVSYRCAVDVVKYAQNWVKHIEPAPNAPTGTVTHLGQAWETEMFGAGNLVVCRTTAPLISTAYTMLKKRQSVMIMGREIGQGLVSLIKKMNARGIDALITKLQTYTAREIEKAIAKKQEAKADAIQDKTDAILCVIDGLGENSRTVPSLIETIQTLFADKANATLLSTIHKAKGMESNKVFWLTPARCRKPTQEWMKQQESNLCYVAVTRAKSELVCISEKA